MDNLKALAEAIVKNTTTKKTEAYETTATVIRIDGEKVYAHIDGGAPETPATATMACKEGDTVRIHVEGGKAWIIGNVSSPATDDTTAEEASGKIEAYKKYVNTIIREYEDGVLVCKSGKNIGALVNSSGSFDVVKVNWSGTTPEPADVIATFSGQKIQIGKNKENNILVDLDSVKILKDGAVVATYSDAVKIGNSDSGHTEISSNEQKFIADDGTIVLDMLRDTSRVYAITETAYTDDVEGQSGSYVNKAKLSYPMHTLVGIYARNGADITKDVTYTYNSTTYTLENMSNADSDGDPGDMKHYIYVKYVPDIDNVTLSVGRYPLADNRGKLLVLGNGVSSSDRRNMLDVDMLGNLRTVGNLMAAGKIYGDFSYTNGEHALIPPDMTYDKFSIPDVYQSRVTNESGGYYKCGRYVYVYIVCKTAITFNIAAAFTGLPTPASKNWANALMPLTALTADGLTVPCYVNQYGSICMTAANGKWVIIHGYYFSASM